MGKGWEADLVKLVGAVRRSVLAGELNAKECAKAIPATVEMLQAAMQRLSRAAIAHQLGIIDGLEPAWAMASRFNAAAGGSPIDVKLACAKRPLSEQTIAALKEDADILRGSPAAVSALVDLLQTNASVVEKSRWSVQRVLEWVQGFSKDEDVRSILKLIVEMNRIDGPKLLRMDAKTWEEHLLCCDDTRAAICSAIWTTENGSV